jgi:hypothetical protein
MNCVKTSLLALPALACAATLAWMQPALAQTTMAPPAAGGITMDQFVARQTARIMAADTDGDGRVSRAEMAAMSGKYGRTALEQRFHRLDLNGDGILTPDERMAARSRQRAAEPASMPPAAQP